MVCTRAATSTTATNSNSSIQIKKIKKPARILNSEPGAGSVTKTAKNDMKLSKATKHVVEIMNDSLKPRKANNNNNLTKLTVNKSLNSSSEKEGKSDKVISKLKSQAEKNEFPEVELFIDADKKKYTPIYNWFQFNKTISKESFKSRNKIQFSCILCNYSSENVLGKPGNLKKHLKTHGESKQWLLVYDKMKANAKKSTIKTVDKKAILLVKFFINSDISLLALKDKYLQQLLPVKITEYTFKNTFLPDMLTRLKDELSFKLRSSIFINLVTDIWSNKAMISYLALAAATITENFKTETFIIGFCKMPTKHNAENIKLAVEEIINELEFNKAKISSINTDEGSNLLRLFKQVPDQIESLNDLDQLNDVPGFYVEDDLEEDENYVSVESDIDLSDTDNNEDDKIDDEENTDDDDDKNDYDELYDKKKGFRDGNRLDEEDEKELLSPEFIENIEFINNSSSNATVESIVPLKIYDDNYSYDFTKGELINDLFLEIGSDKINRFSCSAHKVNLVIRKSIQSSKYVSNFLSSLSKFASTIKKSLENSDKHNKQKSKIHRQNFTRWGSSFKMLFTFYKSYTKGIFNENYVCPQSQDEILKYLQILLPFYVYTNDIQAVGANISQVVPSILSIIYANINRMVIKDKNQNEFRNNLIYFLKEKFNYELHSPIYLVAALLNVNKLDEWRNRSYGKEYYKKSIELILDVFLIYHSVDDSENVLKSTQNSDSKAVARENDEEASNFNGLSQLSRLTKAMSINFNDEKDEMINAFKSEINIFKSLLDDIKFHSTHEFWVDNRKKLPNLYKLALRLLSIPATTAYVERFFNITGIINSKNPNNMSSELLIARSMLKVNLDLLKAN